MAGHATKFDPGVLSQLGWVHKAPHFVGHFSTACSPINHRPVSPHTSSETHVTPEQLAIALVQGLQGNPWDVQIETILQVNQEID